MCGGIGGAIAGAVAVGTPEGAAIGAGAGGVALAALGTAESHGWVEIPGHSQFGLSSEIDIMLLIGLLGAIPGFMVGAGVGAVVGRGSEVTGARVGAGCGAVGAMLAAWWWTGAAVRRNERCAQAGWGTPGCDPSQI